MTIFSDITKLTKTLEQKGELIAKQADEIAQLKEIMIADGIGKADGDEFFWWNEAEWVLFDGRGNDIKGDI